MKKLGLFVVIFAMGLCANRMRADDLRGNASRTAAQPYLNMPPNAAGELPKVLSQVGAFADVRTLNPAAGLVPYEVNAPFWSDGAEKRRWIAVPRDSQIHFSPTGEWRFPAGTVFIKHFERADADGKRVRLETRVLVRDADGGVYGAAYRWRRDNTDADLVTEAITESDPDGKRGGWYYPGRADCGVCHTAVSGGVLGVNTRQLNRRVESNENQLLEWRRLGMFEESAARTIQPDRLAHLAHVDDATVDLEERARSFFDANCSYCHRPGGAPGNFDARYDMSPPRQNLVGGRVLIDLGIDRARVIAPNDPWRSLALVRIETADQTKMPPLAHLTVDRSAAATLREWIASLPGSAVLPPPTIETRGGSLTAGAKVTIKHTDPNAVIRYTLDGGPPLESSSTYTGPVELREAATVRARAFKSGMTRSIVVQETYNVE